MYILLYLIWLILNSRLTVEILLLGLLPVGLISLLLRSLFGYTLKKDLKLLRKTPLLIAYLFVLIREILKANFSVISFIFRSQDSIQPELISFRPDISTKAGQYLLANSITLTPGTITVDIKDGVYTVHCLKASLLDTSDHNIFVRLIRRLEA